MSLFHKSKSAPAGHDVPVAPAGQDGLVSLIKTATVSLTKSGLDGERAAVYLVLDRSGSMQQFYRDGSVQHLAEQALALSANLDDDGIVPLAFFDTRSYPVVDVDLNAYQGAVDRHHQRFGGDRTMGGTRYTEAMHTVLDHRPDNTSPALVLFQTDGQPGDADATISLLQQASHRPVFWFFIGFGPSPVPFLQTLDTLPGRAVDNAAYLHAGTNPRGYSDAALYDEISHQYATWLTAARAAGIAR